MAAHRYLPSPYVTSQGVLEALGARTGEACAGRRVVAAQDTTEFSFSGASAGRRGLGPGGDGKSPGFFIHAVVAVDAEDEALLGVVGARIWTRGPERVAPRRGRLVEAKESRRWTEGAQIAAERWWTVERCLRRRQGGRSTPRPRCGWRRADRATGPGGAGEHLFEPGGDRATIQHRR